MGEIIKQYSFYLASRAGFLTGIGKLFDLSGSYKRYNRSESASEADFKALYSDWLAIGQDMRSAMHTYDESRES